MLQVYIRRLNAMNIPFTFVTAHTTAEESALLDSGATENFIDHSAWKRLKIGKQELHEPMVVRNVDGTQNKQGELTHYCWLRVRYKEKESLQKFYLTDLGTDRVILGYPFLYEFDPTINWKKGQLMEGAVQIETARYKYLDLYVAKLQK